jgi:organic hydroperoxide reductase OsmC/OhrA
MLIEHVLYCAHVKATGGRDGLCRIVRRCAGCAAHHAACTWGHGTNPEQLFAAVYAASFLFRDGSDRGFAED